MLQWLGYVWDSCTMNKTGLLCKRTTSVTPWACRSGMRVSSFHSLLPHMMGWSKSSQIIWKQEPWSLPSLPTTFVVFATAFSNSHDLSRIRCQRWASPTSLHFRPSPGAFIETKNLSFDSGYAILNLSNYSHPIMQVPSLRWSSATWRPKQIRVAASYIIYATTREHWTCCDKMSQGRIS